MSNLVLPRFILEMYVILVCFYRLVPGFILIFPIANSDASVVEANGLLKLVYCNTGFVHSLSRRISNDSCSLVVNLNDSPCFSN